MMNKTTSVLDTMVLNKVQREAVEYIEGPELVFAGAGTGKTRVLTAKIAYLISLGVSAGNLFAATFTNKAAREMRQRIESILGVPAQGLWIGTFHSLCARILRREAAAINYTSSFTIYDSSDQLSIVKKLLKEFDIDDRTMPPKYLLSIISNYKSSCISPTELENRAQGFRDRETAKLYRAYQRTLSSNQAMDFDDLIANTVYLFRENESVLKKYQNLFNYVLVDEYQDTNTAQFKLVYLLSRAHKKIFAVGDDDQSIYGWRGAQIDNILSFENHFPLTRIFKLEQNYRSTKSILDFANAAISPNVNRSVKNLWTDRSIGETVAVNRYRDDRQEADSVAEKTKLLLDKMKGTDIAVLFRTNAQSRVFEEAFRKKRIAYVLVGGTSFYERAEIKDCLAYLKLLVNPRDNASFERILNVPARGLGDKARKGLIDLATKHKKRLLETVLHCDCSSVGTRAQKGLTQLKELFELLLDLNNSGEKPHELLNQVLQLSGYMDMLTQQESEEAMGRMENINELLNAMAYWSTENPQSPLSAFLEEVTLASDVDVWNPEDNSVNFLTMHSAKGLEFRHVFLVGLEDGIIPSRQNLDDDEKIEEERRLFYVGSTRAMEQLDCSYVDQRRRFGEILPSEPTRFFNDIAKELFSFSDNTSNFSAMFGSKRLFSGVQPASKLPASKPRTAFQKAQDTVRKAKPQYDEFSQETVEFRMGQTVVHKSYGRGKILGISGFGEDLKLTVLFNDGSRRKLMAKFANFQ
ncbi:exodeoxyribonuclease V subunit gamma [Chitinispirillales bacterium ANBcel5]|uniref:ATP-dependent helicase n=1 Tax=Cellulosispirillum alkaliphilum TaxID=3039283 RepID=UPI002A56EE41|nr:exodeoxyribonuclease V subunit gamma [Chitinispirillales bacterium ANBcel5]